MKKIFVLSLIVLIALSSCATSQPPLEQCGVLCRGRKVDYFKDEVLECKCNISKEANSK